MAQFIIKDSFELTSQELIVIFGGVKSGELQAGMCLKYKDADLIILSVEAVKVNDHSFTGLVFGYTVDVLNLIKQLRTGDEVLVS